MFSYKYTGGGTARWLAGGLIIQDPLQPNMYSTTSKVKFYIFTLWLI